MSLVGLIWAQANAGAIGRNGEMPWHVPEDLAHFKQVTLGSPVVMGRRTWESLPERFRPLPGRVNIVVTRDPDFVAQGAQTVLSLGAGLELAKRSLEPEPAEVQQRNNASAARAAAGDEVAALSPQTVWVMGGGQIYRAAMPLADELAVTRIDMDVPDADTFAPEIGPEWRIVDAGESFVSASGLTVCFERYLRR
ncbi:MAG: dihydrofolate reductase [Microbacteriaceae bacterium]|nr:dihydrofolate reductase [Microbacteriaceae bacterium]